MTYFCNREIQNTRYTTDIFKTFFTNIFRLQIKWYTRHVFGMITNPAYCLRWYVIFAIATLDLKNEGSIIDYERLHTFVYIYNILHSCTTSHFKYQYLQHLIWNMNICHTTHYVTVLNKYVTQQIQNILWKISIHPSRTDIRKW